jgi:hypothetical protein
MKITKDLDSISPYLKVYFNGERHNLVQALDTIEGWIDVYKIENGRAVLTADKEDVVIERKFGKVEVKLED